jgi:hypothetical protein
MKYFIPKLKLGAKSISAIGIVALLSERPIFGDSARSTGKTKGIRSPSQKLR